jgi:hypothetical protein
MMWPMGWTGRPSGVSSRLAGDLRIDAYTAPTNLKRLIIPAETSR